LFIPSEKKEEMKRILEDQYGIDFSGVVIGISPVAAYGTAKQWLAERFWQLIEKIQENWSKCEILIFGSPKEREKISKIVSQQSKVHNLAGKLSLGESITAISLCHIFISNDSGLMHTAASLRVPLVAIFGPTQPANTGPTNRQGIILHHPVDCAPCKNRNCPLDHKCMAAIEVEEVWQALQRLHKKGISAMGDGQ
jgi:heptosyltransferase-2